MTVAFILVGTARLRRPRRVQRRHDHDQTLPVILFRPLHAAGDAAARRLYQSRRS